MNPEKIIIRPAVIDDAPLILQFVQALAEYEKEPNAVVNTVESIKQILFTPPVRVEALICELAGQAIGFAVYFYNYSTWLGQNGIYLEDLYVQPEHRKIGAGNKLLKSLATIAVQNNCGRLEWSVLNWNRLAIDFYESIGAKPQDEWTVYRLTGDALKSFARK